MGLIRRRGLLGGVAAVGALASTRRTVAWAAEDGKHLTAQTIAGAGDAFKEVYAEFDRVEGTTTTTVPIQSAAAFARMRTETNSPQIDLFQFTGGQERLAAREGLSAPLTSVKRLADVSSKLRDPDGRWVHVLVDAEGILYRTDKVKTPPRSYKDLLDPVYEGHIAFPTIANGYGTDFLVMMAKAHGGSEQNIDPGFQALAKIAAKSVIFRSTAELVNLFSQGDIWVVPYDAYAARQLELAGLPVAFAVPEEGSPAVPFGYAVAAKSPNIDLACKAIDFSLSPSCQLDLAVKTRCLPANITLQLPEQVAAHLPRLDQLVFLDTDLMTTRRPEWTERYNKEIAR